MIPLVMIVDDVLPKRMTERLLAEQDELRETFLFDGCLRCLLLVMCTHPFTKEVLTLYLPRSEGHERYFGCNLMCRKALASSDQHLMAEAPLFLIGFQPRPASSGRPLIRKKRRSRTAGSSFCGVQLSC